MDGTYNFMFLSQFLFWDRFLYMYELWELGHIISVKYTLNLCSVICQLDPNLKKKKKRLFPVVFFSPPHFPSLTLVRTKVLTSLLSTRRLEGLSEWERESACVHVLCARVCVWERESVCVLSNGPRMGPIVVSNLSKLISAGVFHFPLFVVTFPLRSKLSPLLSYHSWGHRTQTVVFFPHWNQPTSPLSSFLLHLPFQLHPISCLGMSCRRRGPIHRNGDY